VPRVLVTENLEENGLARLRQECEVDTVNGLTSEQLQARIANYEGLVVRSQTRVTAQVLAAATRLRVIGRAGTGVDNIDLEAATRHGILVLNTPGGNTVAAAEHTLALMMALARNVPQANASVRAGRWARGEFLGVELRGKTLGVVGLGNVGYEVARRAKAFEMTVIAVDPLVAAKRVEEIGVRLVSLATLLEESDFITLHVPLTDGTRHLLNGAALRQTRAGVRIINVARGGVVDEQALYQALQSGHVAGAALDVFEQEPPGANPLLSLPQVLVTPHLGASTQEAQAQVAFEVADQVATVLRGGVPRTALNAPVVLPEEMAVLAPYCALGEKLGRFYAQMNRGHVETVELQFTGEIARYDCSLITAEVLGGLIRTFTEDRVNTVNARAVAAARGIRVVEQKSTAPGADHATLVTVRVTTDAGVSSVAGMVVFNQPRIVALNDFRIDMVPAGNFLVSRHADRPGIIGAVGTLLGRNNVNIASMQVGRGQPRGDAVMILAVDEEVPEALRAELKRIDGMADLTYVTL
jgi:D-3-phosphoglycerate dehydrogenase